MGVAKDLTGDELHREFQVFIKAVGAACNLTCSYCYYIKNSQLSGSRACQMSFSNLDLYTRQQIKATTGDTITFSWHGGEPLLAGIDFYRKAVALQKEYCPEGKKIINGIQTNGTLVNEAWCRFFAEEKFMVGLSMDGPEQVHDIYRKNKQGTGTFRKVLDAFDQLTLHGIDPEILCVVNRRNANYPLEVYRFFRDLGVTYITYIPLVERKENQVNPYSVGDEQFGEFLCLVFDEWKATDSGTIKVQIFDEALRKALGEPHTLCVFRRECGGVPVIEHDGSLYSCDHFVDEDHYMGNINAVSIASLLDSEKQKQFGRAKFLQLPRYCRQCEVIDMCNGECPKNRFILTPEGEPGLNYLCKGYRKFFNYIRPFAEVVSAMHLKV